MVGENRPSTINLLGEQNTRERVRQRHGRKANRFACKRLHVGREAVGTADDENERFAVSASFGDELRKVDRREITPVLVKYDNIITRLERLLNALALGCHQLCRRQPRTRLGSNFFEFHLKPARKASQIISDGRLRPVRDVLADGNDSDAHPQASASGACCTRCGIRREAHSSLARMNTSFPPQISSRL